MATASQRYAGKVSRVGNSKSLRLDAASFKALPELGGEVQAALPAERRLLFSAQAKRRVRGKEAATLGLVGTLFLSFLERQMRVRPERIRRLDARLFEEIGVLVDGVGLE